MTIDATTAACRVLVSGRVQGVGFRWFTQETAQHFGVGGWVRNLPDGRVECWFEGAPDLVEQALSAVQCGPSFAEVTAISKTTEAPRGLQAFQVCR